MTLQVNIDGAREPINPGNQASCGVVVRHGAVVPLSEGRVVGAGKGMSNNVECGDEFKLGKTFRRAFRLSG